MKLSCSLVHTENTQHFFDEINEYGWDLGGAGPCVRTGMYRLELQDVSSLILMKLKYIEHCLMDLLMMFMTALPYKFKFKVSGCPNDCVNSIERVDFAIIGTWKDDKKVDQSEVKDFVEKKGRQYVIDNVITRCPTNCLSLKDMIQ